jgi:hypothetical protein
VKTLGKGGSFVPSNEYLSLLNNLTDRFSKRGADPKKPNGNPINQVRTNEFLSGVWQMREFNLLPKSIAESITSRKTVLKSDFQLHAGPGSVSNQVGLWTTTTKNNPLIGNRKLHLSLEDILPRWINQSENQILDSAVSPRAPEWMEGAVANQPFGFSYSKSFGFSGARINWARHKFSLSTCSGCHNRDTDTFFQMVKSAGKDRTGKIRKAFFAGFMVGDSKGGPLVVSDVENFDEKHEFFDLREREKIVREVLNLARQVDSARVRLTRTELDGNSSNQLTQVFVKGGVIGNWLYELPENRLNNDLFRIDGNGGIFLRNPGSSSTFGAKQLYLRAKAIDGTGIVLERPYSIWLLKPGESRLSQDLDPSIQPSIAPPLSTPRPNRTH